MTPVTVFCALAVLGCGPSTVRADPALQCAEPRAWPLWETYKARFIEPDGRVVDHFAKHSTSEGQAYALFHALVARDRETFMRVLAWTEKHLARGDLGRTLSAWRFADGKIVDKNPASDADLWMAYALVHAASAFDEPKLAEKGGRLLAAIAAKEVVNLPGLGPMMLPGPVGFDMGDGRWRLNPSYLPIQLLRWAARIDPGGPWAGIVTSTLRLAAEGTPGRVWPDWIEWGPNGFEPDSVTGPVGSYDAIRAYWWPVALAADDDARGALLARGTRFLEATRKLGVAPDRLDTRPGDDVSAAILSPNSPVGFRAIAAAYAKSLGDNSLATRLFASVESDKKDDGTYGEPAFYYDHNLLLFVLGFEDGRYRFRADGGLELEAIRGESCSSR